MSQRWLLKSVVGAVAGVYVVSSFLVEWKTDVWWVRIFDHPRLQLSLIGIGALIYMVRSDRISRNVRYPAIAALVAALGFDAYRVLPYTAIWPAESPMSSSEDGEKITVMTANVLQKNTERVRLLAMIHEESPDLIFLTETDELWENDLSLLKRRYPYSISEPLTNTYGLLLYSRYPLKDVKVDYLVQDDVPSLHGWVELPSGRKIEFYGLHPKPPVPEVGGTTERDGELMIVARRVRETKHPVIVLGDLNDVAWSHSTRLFRRFSGLLDPRIGRGQFSTFPARPVFARFPIDHVFHTSGLELQRIDVLSAFGSDHLPLLAEFSLEEESADRNIHSDREDAREVRRSIRKAKTASSASVAPQVAE